MAKSAVVSAAGFISGFWTELDKAARKRGLGDDEIYAALKEDSSLIEKFADLMVPAAEVAPKPEPILRVFKIRRDLRPVEEKVKIGFNCANPNITSKNFCKEVPANSPDEAILVNFGEDIESSEEGVCRLAALGLRPGLPTELSDSSQSNPDSQELAGCMPTVALGDSFEDANGYVRVAYLSGDASYRELHLLIWQRGWYSYGWFLAFRK